MMSTEIRGTATETTTMKAIVQDRYGPAAVLEARDIDKPEIGADERETLLHGWRRALERARSWIEA